MTKNKKVLEYVESVEKLCNPDNVVWIDGSEELYNKLTEEALATGELIKLNLVAICTALPLTTLLV